jgi:hypothetical protein
MFQDDYADNPDMNDNDFELELDRQELDFLTPDDGVDYDDHDDGRYDDWGDDGRYDACDW